MAMGATYMTKMAYNLDKNQDILICTHSRRAFISIGFT